MSEEPDIPGTQRVRLLSPEDEQTRLIGKAIASETAGKILTLISGREVTATLLSEELSVPVSTVMYHLDNLVSAGLIEVSRMRYSVKGREMKVYRLVDQVLIVSPKRPDIKMILTKCATLLSLPLAVASILAYMSLNQVSEVSTSLSDLRGTGLSMEKKTADYACYSMEQVLEAAPVNFDTAALPETFSDTAVSTFSLLDVATGVVVGALLVVLIFAISSVFRRKKA